MNDLIQSARELRGEGAFDPSTFIASAAELLKGSNLTCADVADLIHRKWNLESPEPDWSDRDQAPFFLDLHREHDWGIRCCIWFQGPGLPWIDGPHEHYRYIATTSLTRVAYRELQFPSIEDVARGHPGVPKDLQRGMVNIIRPDTVHEVLLPNEPGVSLSIRTREVVDVHREYVRESAQIVVNDRLSRKNRVLRILAGAQ